MAAIILGQQYGRTRLQVWQEKAGIIQPSYIADNPDIRRGIRQEPVARQVYVEQFNALVKPVDIVTHPDHEFIRGHPDGEVNDDYILEIKCPRSFMYRRHQLAGVPQEYILQGMHYLACMPDKKGVIFWLFSAELDEGFAVTVERDQEIIDTIVKAECEFWESILERKEPEEKEIKIDLPPQGVSDEFMYLDDEATREAFTALKEAYDIVKAGEELKEEVKKQIIGIMKENGITIIESHLGRIYNRQQAGRTTFDKKKLAVDLPELDLSKYEKRGNPFTTFKPYFFRG